MTNKKKQDSWRRIRATILHFGQISPKWSYFWLALVVVAVILLIQNHVSVVHDLHGTDWVLIKDYLAVILTWPTAILTLGLIFIYKFNNSIKIFLEKINYLKAPGVELSQQQSISPSPPSQDQQNDQQIVENLSADKTNEGITLTPEQLNDLAAAFEKIEFKYLALHLVQNTVFALLSISTSPITKDYFLQAFQLPSQIINPNLERQAIINELLSNELVVENSLLKITEKGNRFLRFMGYKA